MLFWRSYINILAIIRRVQASYKICGPRSLISPAPTATAVPRSSDVVATLTLQKRITTARTARAQQPSTAAALALKSRKLTLKAQIVRANPLDLDAAHFTRIWEAIGLSPSRRLLKSTLWVPIARQPLHLLLLCLRLSFRRRRRQLHRRHFNHAWFATRATRTGQRRSPFCTLLAKVKAATTKARKRTVLSPAPSQQVRQSTSTATRKLPSPMARPLPSVARSLPTAMSSSAGRPSTSTPRALSTSRLATFTVRSPSSAAATVLIKRLILAEPTVAVQMIQLC